MAKYYKGFFNVTGHDKVNIAFLVVPIKRQAKVMGAIPISVASIVLFEGFKEMLNIILVDIFYSKVVDDEGEANGMPRVGPVSGHQLDLAVSCDVEAFFQEFLCNDADLW